MKIEVFPFANLAIKSKNYNASLPRSLYFELFDLRTIKFFLQKTYRTLFGLLFTQVAIYSEKLSNVYKFDEPFNCTVFFIKVRQKMAQIEEYLKSPQPQHREQGKK